MRIQRSMMVTAMAALTAVVVACGGESVSASTPTSSDEAEGSDLGTATVDRELSVEMRDIAFEPLELTARAGEVVDIRFQHQGGILHDFTIDQMDADVMEMMGGSGAGVDIHMGADQGAMARAVHLALDAGQEGRMRLRVHEPGTYTYYCTVPGHREAGMVGTLTID